MINIFGSCIHSCELVDAIPIEAQSKYMLYICIICFAEIE